MTIGSVRAVVAAASIAGAAGLIVSAGPSSALARDAWPTAVTAKYRLKFQGIEVGKMDFSSKTSAAGYEISGGSKLSVLMGAFKVQTSGSASGAIAGGGPTATPAPKSYAFDWRGGKKTGAIKMGFADGVAKQIAVEPPVDDHPERVPLTDKHKAGVVDPITAIMTLTAADGKPCEKKAAVFDGKHRFDITLAFKKQVAIPSKTGGGAPVQGVVCRVTYKPIAGHKQKAETAHFATNRDMEVWLRPLPGTSMMVPHAIYIPTGWGTASMVIERLDATTGATKVALTE
jgi:hypothetical protein